MWEGSKESGKETKESMYKSPRTEPRKGMGLKDGTNKYIHTNNSGFNINSGPSRYT